MVVALGADVLLGGCSSSRTQEVSLVAQRFYTAVTEADGREACVLLSPAARTELEAVLR